MSKSFTYGDFYVSYSDHEQNFRPQTIINVDLSVSSFSKYKFSNSVQKILENNPTKKLPMLKLMVSKITEPIEQSFIVRKTLEAFKEYVSIVKVIDNTEPLVIEAVDYKVDFILRILQERDLEPGVRFSLLYHQHSILLRNQTEYVDFFEYYQHSPLDVYENLSINSVKSYMLPTYPYVDALDRNIKDKLNYAFDLREFGNYIYWFRFLKMSLFDLTYYQASLVKQTSLVKYEDNENNTDKEYLDKKDSSAIIFIKNIPYSISNTYKNLDLLDTFLDTGVHNSDMKFALQAIFGTNLEFQDVSYSRLLRAIILDKKFPVFASKNMDLQLIIKEFFLHQILKDENIVAPFESFQKNGKKELPIFDLLLDTSELILLRETLDKTSSDFFEDFSIKFKQDARNSDSFIPLLLSYLVKSLPPHLMKMDNVKELMSEYDKVNDDKVFYNIVEMYVKEDGMIPASLCSNICSTNLVK